ncbi:MAG: 2-nitropropane dioxygenase [Rubrivivax sp. SCN 71-131]|nr:MAG: 2-nitropropane dioxygenase [Rubrivivax sp. SCN 71-131]
MTVAIDLAARLGLAAPVIQAPMAGAQGHALAAAVCQAGGLGSIPAAMLSPEGLRAEIEALRAHTARPFAVNFFCHRPPEPDGAREQRWRQRLAPYYREYGLDPAAAPAGAMRAPFSAALADLVEPLQPPVVSFHFGLPEPALLARVKRWGALVMASATTVEEARWLQQHGADVVIAQGLEAGGHRGHFLDDDLTRQLGLFALLPQVVQAVSLPVVAAGGIGDATTIAAARSLGAAGVQVGTAYMKTPEATTSALHRALLGTEASRHTALTNLFSGRPARSIVNRLMRECGPLSADVPAFPLAPAALAPLREAAQARGRTDFSSLWAGEYAANCREAPAAELTRGFIAAWQQAAGVDAAKAAGGAA